ACFFHGAKRPLRRLERVVLRAVEARQTADVERAMHARRRIVAIRGEPRMLVEDLVRTREAEAFEAHARCDVADDAPVRARLARRRNERALTRDAPLRVRDRKSVV